MQFGDDALVRAVARRLPPGLQGRPARVSRRPRPAAVSLQDRPGLARDRALLRDHPELRAGGAKVTVKADFGVASIEASLGFDALLYLAPRSTSSSTSSSRSRSRRSVRPWRRSPCTCSSRARASGTSPARSASRSCGGTRRSRSTSAGGLRRRSTGATGQRRVGAHRRARRPGPARARATGRRVGTGHPGHDAGLGRLRPSPRAAGASGRRRSRSASRSTGSARRCSPRAPSTWSITAVTRRRSADRGHRRRSPTSSPAASSWSCPSTRSSTGTRSSVPGGIAVGTDGLRRAPAAGVTVNADYEARCSNRAPVAPVLEPISLAVEPMTRAAVRCA